MKDYARYSTPVSKKKRVTTPATHPATSPDETNKDGHSTSTVASTTTDEQDPASSPRQRGQQQQTRQTQTRQAGQTRQVVSHVTTRQAQPSRQTTPQTRQASQTRQTYQNPRNNSSNNNSTNSDTGTTNSSSTVGQLRKALDDAKNRDGTAKEALAKSDAVILELRSSIRQLKRQLERTEDEKNRRDADLEQAKIRLEQLQQQSQREIEQQREVHSRELRNLQVQVRASPQISQSEQVGELQVQLDRAHAQILTADMVRKELEDTLEAEQYTWELRVQDQERTIQQLQHECANLAEELDHVRHEWKDAEESWAHQMEEWKEHEREEEGKKTDNTDIQERLATLERERSELQSCLDEALQELEAVDAEIESKWEGERERLVAQNHSLQQKLKSITQQGGRDAQLEPLHHLYRWLLEQQNKEEAVHKGRPETIEELVSAIQECVENFPQGASSSAPNMATRRQVAALEAQLSVYRGDLKAREESSSELRASLKEAVALLKPLQDAVAKTDEEKKQLQGQIQEAQSSLKTAQAEKEQLALELTRAQNDLLEKAKHADRLQEQVRSLQTELSQLSQENRGNSPRVTIRGTPHSPPRRSLQPTNEESSEQPRTAADDALSDTASTLSKAREDIRAKRAREKTLRQLLRDAQSRFHTLHQQNQDVQSKNEELQHRLKEAEEHLLDDNVSVAAKCIADTSAPSSPEREPDLRHFKEQLAQKDAQVQELVQQLEHARNANGQVSQLKSQLSVTTNELHAKQQAELVLNRSLKDALALLKPLQMHLEDAEREKKELARELKAVRRRLRGADNISSVSSAVSSTTDNPHHLEMMKRREELEQTVRQLEQENSQLHDALEDLSNNLAANSSSSPRSESRLREEMVELASRYQVTHAKLEDAHVENNALVEALKAKEQAEREKDAQLINLREQLRVSELELENAKYIATTALVKVEELNKNPSSILRGESVVGLEV